MKTFGKVLLGFSAALTTLLVSAAAFAQEAASNAVALGDRDKYIAIAAGLGLGIAAFGGALGQGRAAAAALDGIARNPGASDKLFTPMIIGLALIESLVIYALLISFLLFFKIH
jgi:F-type H+-transporting ATPase subunit c